MKIPENQIRQLCVKTREIFLSETSLLDLSAPVVICGDIHGQYDDLLRHFDKVGYPPASNFLFLGDYVDRCVKLITLSLSLRAFLLKVVILLPISGWSHWERQRERERFKCLSYYHVQREDAIGEHLLAIGVQGQVSWEFLPTARQPWECKYKQVNLSDR